MQIVSDSFYAVSSKIRVQARICDNGRGKVFNHIKENLTPDQFFLIPMILMHFYHKIV